jgi:hypothetical protein
MRRRLDAVAAGDDDECLDDDGCLDAAATAPRSRPLVPATGADGADTQHGLIAGVSNWIERERERENSLVEKREGKRKCFFILFFAAFLFVFKRRKSLSTSSLPLLQQAPRQLLLRRRHHLRQRLLRQGPASSSQAAQTSPHSTSEGAPHLPLGAGHRRALRDRRRVGFEDQTSVDDLVDRQKRQVQVLEDGLLVDGAAGVGVQGFGGKKKEKKVSFSSSSSSSSSLVPNKLKKTKKTLLSLSPQKQADRLVERRQHGREQHLVLVEPPDDVEGEVAQGLFVCGGWV